ncbi:16S rRNA (cytidine(1402)-2'-O)-methyltransferase [Candidatus Peregrinibacteria bacterium]|nr:MAG: 16S rRNA (cytidine(1402)-2'-O)-methyltransferase [Candidatus Peregrinibacteria bacterium]
MNTFFDFFFMHSPQLFIVSTPIGNLDDMTFRAVKTLQNVDTIICEDTRHTNKLLQRYEIKKPLISFHGHSSQQKAKKILETMIEKEADYAYVSDAGTPGISDPAYILKIMAQKMNIKIVPIPGAAAFLTALQAAPLPIHNFIYLGFLPVKKGRQTLLKTFIDEPRTIVFYESVHRIQKTLTELKDIRGEDGNITIGRELTKKFEEFFHGTIQEAIDHFLSPKGEFVVILPPAVKK